MTTLRSSGHRNRSTPWTCTALALTLALAGCKTNPAVSTAAGNVGVAAPAAPVATGPGGCRYLGGAPATAPTPTEAAVVGGLLGAALGGAIGAKSAKRSSVGARNGALLGALAGAVAGSVYAKEMGLTEQDDGSVKVNIPGKVLFASNSAELSPAFRSTLDSIGSTVQQYCGLNARVVGHTDNVGRADYNQALSLRRATAVQQQLVSLLQARGISDRTLQVEGRGMDVPIAPNTTEDGRAQNRRVEIFVIPPAQP